MDAIFADESLRAFPALPPRYRIEAVCGRGGAGTVYRAWDRELGRTVALKVLRDDRPQHRDRMLREARAQARVDHPNVCKVFDSGAEGDRLYIAMQWIDGARLDSIAKELSLERKAAVIRDVADGVHAAHAQSVIHRDLKPANILVERLEGSLLHPYIVDFGLARAGEDVAMTATGEVVGTPYYLAPEQAWGLPVDRRSDVYSLGATLFELLAGRPPFAGDTPAEVMMQVISRPAPAVRTFLPSIPRDLAVITEKCLAKEPERRYDSARALRDDLARWLAGEPIAARSPSLAYRGWSFVRRNRAVAASIVAASLTIGGVAGYRIAQLQREREQGQLAAQLEDRVRYIERFLDYDRALPLHDGRPAVARARNELRALSLVPARFDGPKQYALGRAELAVGDGTAARKSLETAWREDFRTPAVAYYLAVAMSVDYARELAAVDRIQDADTRRSRTAEVDARYRASVLPLLNSARGFAEQPSPFIDARIAAAKGDAARTESLLGSVLARFPWNNEARLLDAEVHVREARTKIFAGETVAASESFDRSRSMYEQAAVIAPSDARIRDGLCQVAVDRMQLAGPFNTQLTAEDEPLFARARNTCEQALVVDPDRVSTLTALASAWSIRSVQLMATGQLGAAALQQQSITLVERALRLAPNDPAVLEQAGLAYWRMGIGRGYAERAVACLRRAVALNPRSPDVRHSFGRALLMRHDELEVEGGDSRAVLLEAEQQYREAIRLAPDFVGAQSNLAITLNHLGNYFSDRGADPEPYYRRAIAILEPLIAKHPSLGEPQSICAWSWFELARHRLETGAGASAELANAERYYTAAIAMNPDYAGDRATLSAVYMKQAELATDDSVREDRLRRADEDLRSVEAHGAPDGRRAEWYGIQAIHAKSRREAAADLDRGDAIVADAIRRQPYPDGHIWILRGRMQRIRCALSLPGCDPVQPEVSFRRALEIAPTLKRVIGTLRQQDDALLRGLRPPPSG
jgi:serine/threonine-protein kinase